MSSRNSEGLWPGDASAASWQKTRPDPGEIDHGGPDARGAARWDFSTNAHAAGPEPGWLAALAEADPTRYPDPTYTALREALGALHGVPAQRILPAASASEAIVRISSAVALLRPGARVNLPRPAYGDYARAAQACGLQPQRVGDDASPALSWATEPGSPCGESVAPAAWADPAVLQVIDRAYAPLRLEGAEPALPPTAWQLWSPNKALALTGVRGAYLVAPPEVEQPDHPQADWARRLQALAPSWPLGAQAVAMLQLWAQPATQAKLRERLALLREWKRRQIGLYERLGWSHRPSVTPFGVVAWLGSGDAQRRARVLAALRDQGVQLRDAAGLGLSGWLRLSVQPPAAQDALECAWRRINKEEEQGMTQARAIMVLGTTSGAGKSWLATALCRWYARQGLKVAPFKAQNMSNNARVVPGPGGGMGEIGSAQYFQALAARCVPEVRHNPVLLKPEHDTGSQVVVLGEVRRDLAAVPWRERSEALWPFARAALAELMAENDVVVIEGAGSPAEINLHASDYVNMRSARAADATCLLVTDIDRGGAFAHLFGTWALLPPAEAALIRGFVLNRFRGDAALLAPGPQQLQALTGVPTVATLPMWREHGLPEEDGVYDGHLDPLGAGTGAPHARPLRVAVVAWPRISNLDEFQALRNLPQVRLVWARQPADLEGADWIVLPGSKLTSADLAWLRAQRLDAAIAAHVQRGGAVLGICGGLQVLGETLTDPDGVESSTVQPFGGDAPGMGLLPLVTRFERDKRLTPVRASFGALEGAWAALSGVAFDGYEIHQGVTVFHPSLARCAEVLRNPAGEVLGWQQGNVLGLYAHGLFESPEVLQALFGARCSTLDEVFDGLADYIDRHFEPGVLAGLLQPA